jgi:flagellar hook-associated protein 1 FlgK
VNAIHQGGVTRTGSTGANFFDPAGVTAASIALDAVVLASTDAIAAGGTAAPGDADVALALAALGRSAIPGLGGLTFRAVYAGTASRLGQLVRNSMDDATASQVLADRADAARQSASGVSIDEEMVVLLQQQQAYQAAARLVSLADELMDEVMRMI